jgi:hypothetical protein
LYRKLKADKRRMKVPNTEIFYESDDIVVEESNATLLKVLVRRTCPADPGTFSVVVPRSELPPAYQEKLAVFIAPGLPLIRGNGYLAPYPSRAA